MEAEIHWHPTLLEIVAKTLGKEMKAGLLWEVMRPTLMKKAESILNVLLREGYEVRRIEDGNDPPPVPLIADPSLFTTIIRP